MEEFIKSIVSERLCKKLKVYFMNHTVMKTLENTARSYFWKTCKEGKQDPCFIVTKCIM